MFLCPSPCPNVLLTSSLINHYFRCAKTYTNCLLRSRLYLKIWSMCNLFESYIEPCSKTSSNIHFSIIQTPTWHHFTMLGHIHVIFLPVYIEVLRLLTLLCTILPPGICSHTTSLVTELHDSSFLCFCSSFMSLLKYFTFLKTDVFIGHNHKITHSKSSIDREVLLCSFLSHLLHWQTSHCVNSALYSSLCITESPLWSKDIFTCLYSYFCNSKLLLYTLCLALYLTTKCSIVCFMKFKTRSVCSKQSNNGEYHLELCMMQPKKTVPSFSLLGAA